MRIRWEKERYTGGDKEGQICDPPAWVAFDDLGRAVGMISTVMPWHQRLSATAYHEPAVTEDGFEQTHFTSALNEFEDLESAKTVVSYWLTDYGHRESHDQGKCRFA